MPTFSACVTERSLVEYHNLESNGPFCLTALLTDVPFIGTFIDIFQSLFLDVSANSVESVTECFRRLFNNSEVQDVLQEAIKEGGEAVVDRYLHDFIHMSYKPQDDDELEVTYSFIRAVLNKGSVHHFRALKNF